MIHPKLIFKKEKANMKKTNYDTCVDHESAV